MKVVVAYEVPAATYAAVQELIKASALRDIDLQGVCVNVERGEFTCVDVEDGDDEIDASCVLKAVHAVIDGTRDVPAGKGLTVFDCYYDRG